MYRKEISWLSPELLLTPIFLEKRREAACREWKLLLGRCEGTADRVEFRMSRSIRFHGKESGLELLALAYDN